MFWHGASWAVWRQMVQRVRRIQRCKEEIRRHHARREAKTGSPSICILWHLSILVVMAAHTGCPNTWCQRSFTPCWSRIRPTEECAFLMYLRQIRTLHHSDARRSLVFLGYVFRSVFHRYEMQMCHCRRPIVRRANCVVHVGILVRLRIRGLVGWDRWPVCPCLRIQAKIRYVGTFCRYWMFRVFPPVVRKARPIAPNRVWWPKEIAVVWPNVPMV